MKQVYLDYNSTSPMEHGVIDAMLPFFSAGNASSIHWSGRSAKRAIEDAKEKISQVLDFSSAEDIFFTSSGTESINTALKGTFFLQKSLGKNFHLITTTVEHEATLETARFLQQQGAYIHWLPVNAQGEISIQELKEQLTELSNDKKNFLLVSLMAANNETGVIFPIQEVAELCQNIGALLHVDAVQALGKIPHFSITNTKADLLSVSAHKIAGPKGIGFLYVKKGIKLEPLLHGGAQERKRRAGTQNVAGIVGFAKAIELLRSRDYSYVEALRNGMESTIKTKIFGVHIQGEQTKRVGNTSNLIFDGVRGEGLLLSLDVAGFAVSSGSACNSGSINPSHVLLAMGMDKAAASSALRISLSPNTTQEEITSFIVALNESVTRIRKNAERQRGLSLAKT